ncbi:MAG: succinylglutamate-semialdehyde dehydrogenase [bacterium]|nr:succinylglutamate-semialdehyde dehydrogenase [bacterium]
MTHFSSVDPSSGNIVWHGKSANEADILDCTKRSKSAFKLWKLTSIEDRIATVTRFKYILESRIEEMALCIAESTGKPLWEATGEAKAMAAKCDISIAAFQERCKPINFDLGETHYQAVFKPHGVLVVLGPYNFPGHIPNGHIVPSLIAGNTVIFKPSEFTPKVADLILEFWIAAGLPEHVLQVLHGDGSVGAMICQSPDINGICFTGSSRVGKLISASVVGSPSTIVALEMGGNNPLIVHDHTDAMAAAVMVVQSAFLSAGQRCTCARRLILTPGAPKDLIERILSIASKLRIGGPQETPPPFMGPLIHNNAVQSVLDTCAQLQAAGADVLLQPKRLNRDGSFVSPGIIFSEDASLFGDSECFGPLLCVTRAADLDEAISIANSTQYGLAAALIGGTTADFEHVHAYLNAGVINWNAPTTGASSKLPFGGIGDSGNHRPSAYFAADYTAYPVASTINQTCVVPAQLPAGFPDETEW